MAPIWGERHTGEEISDRLHRVLVGTSIDVTMNGPERMQGLDRAVAIIMLP